VHQQSSVRRDSAWLALFLRQADRPLAHVSYQWHQQDAEHAALVRTIAQWTLPDDQVDCISRFGAHRQQSVSDHRHVIGKPDIRYHQDL